MSPVASLRRDSPKEQPEATIAEITKGLVLFSSSIALYSVYTLMIKVMMQKYTLNVPELTFYVSSIMVLTLYLFSKYYD